MEANMVGRQGERQWFLNWLSDNERQTTILAVTGIPGVGKTFLMRYFEQLSNAKGVQSEWLDCALSGCERFVLRLHDMFEKTSSFPGHSNGCQTVMDCRDSEEPFILFLDHLDGQSFTESYLRNQFIHCLPKRNILLVLAKRTWGPIHWSSQRSSMPAWHDMLLEPFTRTEAMQFYQLVASQLELPAFEQMVGISAGHPMGLMQLAYQPLGRENLLADVGLSNVVTLLTEPIDDTALMDAVCVLAHLLEGNQEEVAAFLDEDVSWLTYREVTKLPYIQNRFGELVFHPVAAHLLRIELRRRMPQKAERWSQRALATLLERIERALSTKKKEQWLSQLWMLLGEAKGYHLFPPSPVNAVCYEEHTAHRISFLSGPQEKKRLIQCIEGTPELLAWFDDKQEIADWLEKMEQHNEHWIHSLQDSNGQPVAIQFVVLRIEQLPKRIRAQIGRLSIIEKELGMAIDTVSFVFSLTCFAEVSDEIADEWRTRFLSCQLACQTSPFQPLLFCGDTAIPTYLRSHPWVKQIPVSGTRDSQSFALFALHLQKLDLCFNASFPGSISSGRPANQQLANSQEPIFSENDVRDLLQHLHHLDYLDTFVQERKLNLSVSELRDRLVGILVADQVPLPLTREQQRLLRITYMDRPGTVIAIAHRLAMSRTTYYRILAQAHHHFTLALRV